MLIFKKSFPDPAESLDLCGFAAIGEIFKHRIFSYKFLYFGVNWCKKWCKKGTCRFLLSGAQCYRSVWKKERKENFYHGILLGILGTKKSWAVSSNGEAGDGYSDIQIEIIDEEIGIIIEVKYADSGGLDAASQEALEQIEKMHYDENLKDDGIDHILKYGIACYKKRCKVMLADS